MKIALIQTNPVIGDFSGNCEKILSWVDKAKKCHCNLAVFPELSLSGYPPQDLLERSDFLESHDRYLDIILAETGDIGIILGALEQRTGIGKPLYNSALLLKNGQILGKARKQLLPTYDVFDETRYFEPGSASTVITYQDLSFGLTICEDIWYEDRLYPVNPVASIIESGNQRPDCLINISASPYYHGKIDKRNKVFSALCKNNALPLLYANQVGGQDSLVFDGHSMVINHEGKTEGVSAGFKEDMLVVDTDTWQTKNTADVPEDSIDNVLAALTLGVRDYLTKTGFSTAILGLSGGIDSAVTAAIACRAIGPEKVMCVALPSPYTSQASVDDALLLTKNLNCQYRCIKIRSAMEAYSSTLEPFFAGLEENVTEQNIQARIRGNLLMALSNKFGNILLSTGNKSEMAVGYCTLYGDMSGGLAVLADVPKQMVYALARRFNKDGEIIPERIITRPPTAELKPDQCDQDDLPPYEILDPILNSYLEEHLSIDEITKKGFDRTMVKDVIRRIKINEYKRRQAPVGIKVTTKAFGHGRRYPIVQNFID